jgi:hypothetical protein
VRDRWVPLVAVAGPLLCALVEQEQARLFAHYRLGLELLILNGALVLAGLFLISTPAAVEQGRYRCQNRTIRAVFSYIGFL